jgi:iron complex outermembrane receptor protein
MRPSNKKTKLMNRSIISTAVLMALYGGNMGVGYAQEGADAAPAATVSDQKIDKVIVTARRRAELIQDVPGAVTALSGAELEKQAIPDITALTDTVPNTTLKASR